MVGRPSGIEKKEDKLAELEKDIEKMGSRGGRR